MKSELEINGFGSFAANSPELRSFNYNNLTILSAKDSISNPRQKPLGGEMFAILQT
jgi:hypothetical protein